MRPGSLRALCVLFVVAQAILFISSVAMAGGSDATRIAVYVEGNDAKNVRKDILGALPDSLTVVDEGKTEAALRASGVKGHVADMLSKEDKRKKAAPKLSKAAARLGAETILVASVSKGKGDRDIAVLVVHGKNDVAFDTVSIEAKDGPASKAYKWESFVAASVTSSTEAATEKKAAAEPPPEPKPKKEEEAPPEKEQIEAPENATDAKEPERDEPSERSERGVEEKYDRALAVIGVAYDSGTRGFSYKDPVTSNLRPYNVTNTPGIAASLELYPLAGSRKAVLSDLAIAARMSRAFAFDSNTTNGQSVSTTWQDVEVGLRGRIHTGRAGHSPLLGGGVAFASSVFDFGSSTAARDLPSAHYEMLRLEFDGRIPFGAFAALAELSYLQVFDAAPMSDRFPHEGVHGVGGRIGLAARALPWLEGRLDFRYDHIFYKMFPEVGDTYVAGGALDQRLAISLGAFVYF